MASQHIYLFSQSGETWLYLWVPYSINLKSLLNLLTYFLLSKSTIFDMGPSGSILVMSLESRKGIKIKYLKPPGCQI